MSFECITDSNCTGNEVCYLNVSWYENGVGSLCACNSFWGWQGGPDCQELGPSSYFIICAAGLAVLISSYALVLAIFDGISFCKHKEPAFDLKMCYSFTAMTLFFIFMWNLLTLVNVLRRAVTDTLFVESFIGEFRRSDPTEEKFAALEDIEGLMGYLASIFGVLSYSNISLVWWGGKSLWLIFDITLDEAVSNAKSLRRYNKNDRLRTTVRIFQVVFIITLIPAVVLQEFPVAVWIVIVAQFIVFIAYTAALVKFVNLLSTTVNSEDKYGKLINTLRNNAIIVTIFILIQSCASIAYVIYQVQGWKQVSPVGEISQYALARETAFLAAAVSNAVIYSYVHGVVKGRNERLQSAAQEKATSKEEYTLATQNF